MTGALYSLSQMPGQPEFPGLVHALGWTLLHFCWQGAVVATLLWCALGLLPARLSRARYAAALCALGLMAALPVATFARLAADELRAGRATAGMPIVIQPVMLVVAPGGAPQPLLPQILRALDNSAPWVPALWLAGVLVFLARLNLGLLLARRMQAGCGLAPPQELQRAFDRLRAKLGVARAVRLAHSAIVQVPTVIGWLRPVVLVPVGCLTGLSAAQIEAILAHELAHIQRHDYLVSVAQSVVEALLFYHPAVWWVSRQVRRERESCCDDVAVALSGDRISYARALSWLEEHRAAAPELALGANGGVLKMRIRRLLGYGDSPVVSRALAAILLVAAGLLAGSYFATVAQGRAMAATRSVAEIALERDSAAVLPVLKPAAQAKWMPKVGVAEPMLQQAAQATAASDLKPPYSTWLEQDVLWLITPAERAAFVGLTSDEDRDRFIARFWAMRDPPSAPANSFKQEYYARMAWANEHFASDRHVGWRTNRGHIYLVYGKPTSIDAHPSGGGGNSGTPAYPYEIWHYRHIEGMGDGSIDVEFVDTCGCGNYDGYTIRRSDAGPGMSNLQQEKPELELAARILTPGAAGPRPQTANPAAAAGEAQERGSIAGTIVDPAGAGVPQAQVTVVNTDTGVNATAVSGTMGKYLVSGLQPGPYNVEVVAKGFLRLLQENVQVGAKQQVEIDLKLSVSAQNTTVSATRAPATTALAPQPFKASATPANGLPQTVSAGALAGNLLTRVDPVYPDVAKKAHVEGAVVLQAVIGKDGTIKELQYISGPAMLVVSAIEAVQHWTYKPYLLNGEPTEVQTTIEVNYTFEGSKNKPAQPADPKNMSEAPKRIGGNVTAPALVYQLPPEYTPEAKQAKTEGKVLLNLVVDGNGMPQNVRVLRGIGNGLDEKAVEAVKQYRFKPAMENGKPVAVYLNVEVNFKIF